jgi:hypothetical protein
MGLRQIEHEVVGPDGDDRALDLLEPAQQRDLDVLTGMHALRAGRNDDESIRPDERGQHAGTPRQRSGDETAPDPAEPHAHVLVLAHRGGHLARQPRAGAGTERERGALEPGEQR